LPQKQFWLDGLLTQEIMQQDLQPVPLVICLLIHDCLDAMRMLVMLIRILNMKKQLQAGKVAIRVY
jgi:hypothetical protein